MLSGVMGKHGGAKFDSTYREMIERASKSLCGVDSVKPTSAGHSKPRSLEQLFEMFTSRQLLGSDGYCCLACNEGEQLNTDTAVNCHAYTMHTLCLKTCTTTLLIY